MNVYIQYMYADETLACNVDIDKGPTNICFHNKATDSNKLASCSKSKQADV